MVEKMNRNVRLVAETSQKTGFDIYLDFSGNREYLMAHRYNKDLYNILKDGIKLVEFERSTRKLISDSSQYNQAGKNSGPRRKIKNKRNRSKKFENSLEHVINVANEYMEERRCVA
ncbi:MAG: hypothetical protein E7241_00070 [Lachnospiraceae bacterium]|nr:hypothetical protein [Lachnospiraceae bacterium]